MIRRHLLKWLIVLCAVTLAAGCGGVRARPDTAVSAKVSGKKDASYYYVLSEIEARKNNLPKALEYIDQALKQDSGQARFWFKRAFLHAASGDLKAAEGDAQKALEIDPRDDDTLVLMGKIHQSQDRRPQAIAAYRQALQIDPRSEDANVLLIETYVAQKDFRSTLAQTASWQRADPENVMPFFYEAWIHQNFTKNSAKAVAAYQKVLNVDPDNTKALSALAELYVARKDEKNLLDVFRQMEARTPNDVSLKLKFALVYYEQKQYGRAIAKFQELLAVQPDDDRVNYYLGVVYENLNKDAEAEGQFLKIPVKSTFYRDAQLHLSFLKIRGRRPEEAIRVLEEAIHRKPSSGAFYEYLSQIHRDQGRFDAAIEVLKKGLSRSSEKEPLYYTLGIVYDKAGRFEECVRTMRQVLRINPQNVNALNYIGYSYADRGIRLDEALTLVQSALALKPDDGYITDSVGWAYFQRGELEEAFKYIQKAYGLVPGEPTITEHLGDVYRKKGDTARALKYYREAAAALEKKKEEKESGKELERVRQKIKEVQSR